MEGKILFEDFKRPSVILLVAGWAIWIKAQSSSLDGRVVHFNHTITAALIGVTIMNALTLKTRFLPSMNNCWFGILSLPAVRIHASPYLYDRVLVRYRVHAPRTPLWTSRKTIQCFASAYHPRLHRLVPRLPLYFLGLSTQKRMLRLLYRL